MEKNSVINKEWASSRQWISCPFCEEGRGHHVAISVVMVTAIKNQDDRALITGFKMVGECGHDWSLNFEFHKGQTFMVPAIYEG